MNALLCFAFLFTAHPALANAPDYRVPENVRQSPRTCHITERVRLWENGRWSDWITRKTTQSWQSARWEEGNDTYILLTAPEEQRFLRLWRDNDELRETTERWLKTNGEWQKSVETITVIYVRENGDLRRLEKYEDGRQFEWRLSSGYQGRLQETKELVYPGVLDRPDRRYGRYVEACDVYFKQ